MFKERKNANFVKDDFAIVQSAIIDPAILISTSALISKTEPKTLKTPLQEHQKELEIQTFGRSHVGDLAILQS